MLTITHPAYARGRGEPVATTMPGRHVLIALAKKAAIVASVVVAVVAVFAIRAWVYVPWPA